MIGHVRRVIGHVRRVIGHVRREIGHVRRVIGHVRRVIGHASILHLFLSFFRLDVRVRIMVLKATFNNISVHIMVETAVPGENNIPAGLTTHNKNRAT